MKKILRILLVVVLAMTLTACSSKEEEKEKQFISESNMVSVAFENRAWTNGYGGVKGYYPYICYIFIDEDGAICYDEHQLRESYKGFIYEVTLNTTDEEDKVVRYEQGNRTIYEIFLTQETYEQLLTSEINPQS